jgi:guanylate kinase
MMEVISLGKKKTLHNHQPVPNEIEIGKAIKTILATDPSKPAGRIIQQLKEDFHVLSSNSTLRQRIYRERTQFWPKAPKNAFDINLDDFEGAIRDRGANWRKFRLFDKTYTDAHDKQQRIMIFGKKAHLKHMAKAHFWCADGTFKCVKQFEQLYVIHSATSPAKRNFEIKDFRDYYYANKVAPVLYCFMTARDSMAYSTVYSWLLSEIKMIDANFEGPSVIIQDFELASRNVMKELMPDTDVMFCYFHYSQSLWRRLMTKNSEAYKIITGKIPADTKEAKKMRYRCCKLFKDAQSMAIMNPHSVINYFETQIKDQAPECLSDFVKYLEDNYIGALKTVGRSQAPTRAAPR